MIDLRSEIAQGLKNQARSLYGEPLVDIMEKIFGDEISYWLDSIEFIPSNQLNDIRDFVKRASNCPGWSNSIYYDFYDTIDELINIAGLSEADAIKTIHNFTRISADYPSKASNYFEIIGYCFFTKSDKIAAIDWIKIAIIDLERLDWTCSNFTPQSIFPNYPLDGIEFIEDLGHALFTDGKVAQALNLWASLGENISNNVLGSILHAVFEYSSKNLKDDLDYLIEYYKLMENNDEH